MALIRTAAKELPRVELTDALLICLVMHEREPDRYNRAAVRWVARFVTEKPDATLLDIELAAACLRSPGRPAAEQLAVLCERHGLRDTAVAVRQAIAAETV